PGGGAFLAKLDAGGVPLWALQLAQNDTVASAVALGPAGQVAITGTFRGTMTVEGTSIGPSPNYFGYTFAFDADGHPLFARNLGVDPASYAARLAFDAAGGLVLGGSFSAIADGETSLSIDLGFGPMSSDWSGAGFIARYAADGTPCWGRVAG